MNFENVQTPISIWPDFYKNQFEPLECDWYDPLKPPFVVTGLAFREENGDLYRYPKNVPNPLPYGVVANGMGTSGVQIRFSAITSRVCIRVKLGGPAINSYNTCTLCGAGFDLYAAGEDGKYVFCGVTNFDTAHAEYESPMLNMKSPKKLDFILNFPLRDRVVDIFIGVDPGAKILPPPPFCTDRRIVVYGGSIMHGYSASRPGMIMTNILSRRLNQEIINLGVSGSAKCEKETAVAVAMVERTSLLIISAEGNCPTPEFITEHMTEFIETYREIHPDVPIAVMGYMPVSKELINEAFAETRLAKKKSMMDVVDSFKARGDKNIYYWDGEDFVDGENDYVFEGHSAALENTVDTTHKSDLGTWMMANGVMKKIRALGPLD